MGKDHLTQRQDLWTTRRMPTRPPLARSHFREWDAPPRPQRFFSFRTFRLISPFLIPFLLGMACFALLLLLSLSSSPDVPLAIGVDGLWPIFFVYGAAGVILAAALMYAPNDTIWALAMLAGLMAFSTITLWAMFGPLVGLALIIGLLGLLILFVRRYMHTVLEDTVHAMVLFGKHHRTLRPGFNLRLPGEQVWAIISTAEVTVDVLAREVILRNGARMDVSATAACRAMPEWAHLTASHGNEWAAHAQRSLELAIRETLSEMEPEEIFLTEAVMREPAHGDPLAVRLKGRLQHLIGNWGLSVEWVRPHSCQPAGPTTPVRPTEASRPAPTPDVASGPQATVMPRGSGVTAALPPFAPGTLAAVAFPVPDVAALRRLAPSALASLPRQSRKRTLAPEALADAYAAVRERRITDPSTILRLADAFEALAGDPLLAPHLPFDAHEAARNLRLLVQKLA
jgi:hypothetical protein